MSLIDKINTGNFGSWMRSVRKSAEADPVKSKKVNNTNPKQWTVLYYIDGNNNLAPMAKHSFSSLLKEGSDENVNLVAQVAALGEGCFRGYVGKGQMEGKKELGAVNMGDPKSLQDFIEYSVLNHPASNYLLVLWDHGAGFKGSMTDDVGNSLIDNKELSQVLENIRGKMGEKIDIVNFNACLMNGIETFNDLKDVTDYVVGSEEVESGLQLPVPGIYGTTPQHKVVKDIKDGIKQRGKITPEQVAKLYVFESRYQYGGLLFTPTQSAVNMKKVGSITESADKLATVLLSEIEKDPKAIDLIRSDIKKTQRYLNYDMYAEPYVDFRDMGDFAKVLKNAKHYNNPAVKDCAENLLKSVKDAVIAERHTTESFGGRLLTGSTGISVFLPRDYGYDVPGHNPIDDVTSGGTHGYEKTSFAQNTKWDELLKAISKDNDIVGKLTGKYPYLRQVIEKGLPLCQSIGYENSWSVVRGATKPNWAFLPISIPKIPIPIPIPIPGPAAAVIGVIGGGFRSEKGVSKIAESFKEYKTTDKVKMVVSGIVDTVAGISCATTCGALLAGTMNIALPAAITATSLIIGKTALTIGAELLKSYQVSKLSIEDKIRIVDEDMDKTGRKSFSFIEKANSFIRNVTGVDFGVLFGGKVKTLTNPVSIKDDFDIRFEKTKKLDDINSLGLDAKGREEFIETNLNDEDVWVREAAARVIGKSDLESGPSERLLRKAYADKDFYGIKESATMSVGKCKKLNPDVAYELLNTSLDDKINDCVRMLAAEAIPTANLTPEMKKILVDKALNDTHEAVRMAAEKSKELLLS